MNYTSGPWFYLKNNEYVEDNIIKSYNEEYEENKPYVRIVNKDGKTITTNHDLFEFSNPNDAKLISNSPTMYNLIQEIKELVLLTTDENLKNKILTQIASFNDEINKKQPREEYPEEY